MAMLLGCFLCAFRKKTRRGTSTSPKSVVFNVKVQMREFNGLQGGGGTRVLEEKCYSILGNVGGISNGSSVSFSK